MKINTMYANQIATFRTVELINDFCLSAFFIIDKGSTISNKTQSTCTSNDVDLLWSYFQLTMGRGLQELNSDCNGHGGIVKIW